MCFLSLFAAGQRKRRHLAILAWVYENPLTAQGLYLLRERSSLDTWWGQVTVK